MAAPTPEHIKQAVIELYSIPINSIKSISSQLCISEPTISKILKNAHIQIRKINYQKLNIDSDMVNYLYHVEKLSTYQIAKKLNCSDETIRKMVDEIRDAVTRNKLLPESIEKIRAASLLNWTNDEYITKVMEATNTDEYKQKLREAGLRNYHTSLGQWVKTAEAKLIISRQVKAIWNDPDYRAKQAVWIPQRMAALTEASVRALNDPIKRKQWIDKLRCANANVENNGWISSSQKQLYYILSMSGIEFYEEGSDTKIGPFYTVDCVIPKQQNMRKPLIIKIQGEYWHSLPHVIIKDRQKATYVKDHTDYDLLAIEELHLKSFHEIDKKFNEFGLILHKDVCKPKQLQIKQITESEASMFYSIFHYSGSIRKGAIVFGAYFGNKLIAAISYCYPLRTQTAKRLGYELKEVVEISRLARCTNVVCRNLASYLIAHTKKSLPPDVKCIVSFSDSAYGHTGGVYKASGFIADGIIEPDYFYISINGRYHKKTIWDRSKRMKMTENEYATKHNLVKVHGREKTRWILYLNQSQNPQ